jgi:hypothetical protein
MVKTSRRWHYTGYIASLVILCMGCQPGNNRRNDAAAQEKAPQTAEKKSITINTLEEGPKKVADSTQYRVLMLHLVHNRPNQKWPVNTAAPPPGAILPYKRVVAFYGNFYSKNMGILGALPSDEMLNKLLGEVRKWEQADTMIPVIPAIHYIVVSAQRNPMQGGKYRLRMPFSQVDKALKLANTIGGIVFLDVQVGHSTVQEELPLLEPYLKRADVHLAIDPEYSMKGGEKPCSVIGTFDAADVNYASAYLAGIVRKYKLPPKILVVHRFTKPMLTNYKKVELHPEVQIVMDMDGFGSPAKKINSYNIAVTNEPVQFGGFKLFYKNDVSAKWEMMRPEDVLNLYPSPIYIQYQ